MGALLNRGLGGVETRNLISGASLYVLGAGSFISFGLGV